MRRRQPPRAGAPKLSPAESKWTSISFCCALPCAADIRPSAGAFPASPRPGVGPFHGSPVEARCVSRTCRPAKYKAIWPPVGPGGAPGVRNGALALERCAFYSKVILPPQRGAHFPDLAGHEHHLGSSKLSSRWCVVRSLKHELSLQRGAFLHSPAGKCF